MARRRDDAAATEADSGRAIEDGLEDRSDADPVRPRPEVGDIVHFYPARTFGLGDPPPARPLPAIVMEVHEDGTTLELAVVRPTPGHPGLVWTRSSRVPFGEDGNAERWCLGVF